ncbi:conserved hypothetical protein [Ricinus communis]|uniref:Uncharacterized protein n=1 Tax=Ricinus communis TaxID=3988 RepID=B9T8W6_RICCO|nr:conserved hypothetical protein [Ricinus communis]
MPPLASFQLRMLVPPRQVDLFFRLGFVPEAKLRRRVASPLLYSLWRRKLEELTGELTLTLSLFDW